MISMTWPQYQQHTFHCSTGIRYASPKVIELLLILLLRQDRPTSRGELIEMLWSDADREPEYSFNLVSRYVITLRKAIKGEACIECNYYFGYTLINGEP